MKQRLTEAQKATAAVLAEIMQTSLQKMKKDPRPLLVKSQEILDNPHLKSTFWQACATDPAESMDLIKNLIKNPSPKGAEIAYTLLTTSNYEGSNALFVFSQKAPNDTMDILKKAPGATKVGMLSCANVAGELSFNGWGEEIMTMIEGFNSAEQCRILYSQKVSWGLENAGFKDRVDAIKTALEKIPEYAPGY